MSDEQRFQTLEGAVATLQRNVQSVSRDLRTVVDAINSGALSEPAAEESPEILWVRCGACHSKMAVYDQDSEEIRLKFKDQYAAFKGGTGGRLRLVCRACGNLNEYDQMDDADTETAKIKPYGVAGD